MTTLAEISTRWSVKRLADVFQTQLGKMLSEKARTGFNPKPYLRNANVQWERADLSNVYVMDFTEEEQRRFALESGDLLMCEGGEIGRTCLWRGELSECFFQKAIHRLRPRSTDVVPEFYLYWMEWAFRFANLYGMTGTQTTIAHLPQEKLAELRIPVPSTSEQRTIAHAVRTVQKAREARQRELALERERKAALMENLFTQGTRGEQTKHTDIGDIPNGWDVSALADVAVISSGGTPDRTKAAYWGGAIPWVKTGEIRYNTILATEERITQEGLDNSAAKVYPRGTLLMAMYGQGVTRGKVAILGIDASINQACAAITPSDGRLLPRFAFYYLQFTYERIRILGHGANQKNLNSHLVGSIQVPIPSPEEQLEIGTVFSAMDTKLDAIEREIGILEELFGVMLQQLLTGGVSVSSLVAGENG